MHIFISDLWMKNKIPNIRVMLKQILPLTKLKTQSILKIYSVDGCITQKKKKLKPIEIYD